MDDAVQPRHAGATSEPRAARSLPDRGAGARRVAQREGLHGHGYLVLLGCAILFLVVWRAPFEHAFEGIASYLPLHLLAETASIVVSILVFGVTWNAYASERPVRMTLVACGCLGVALIDFAHMLSFQGMPDFVTPASPEKAINFWLAARFLTAATMLGVALYPTRNLQRADTRYVLLAAVLALVAVVYWVGLAHQDLLPRTFVEGEGLTATKVAAEYLIVAVFVLALAGFLSMGRARRDQLSGDLAAACAVFVLSELAFTLYSAVTDVFNLLGHVFKVVGYGYIYHGIFVAAVREPFERLVRANQAIAASEASLHTASLYARSLIEASLDAMVTISPEGKITDVNRATEEATAVSRDRLIGTDFCDYFTEPEKALAGYREVLRTGSVRDYPLTIRAADGRTTDVHYNASVYRNEAGGLQGVLAAARDITGIKRSEQALARERQRLHDMLEVLPSYVVLLTADYREAFANRVFRQRFGESHGRRCYEHLFGRSAPCEVCETYKVLATNQPHHWSWQGPDGRLYDVHDFPFVDSTGATQILEMGMDITDRARAEAEVRRLNRSLEARVARRTEELAAANEELEAFAYSVSHDLRAPLRAIDGFSNALLEDYAPQLDAQARDYLDRVRAGVQRMSDLIDEMLQLSRMTRGELSCEKVDLSALAQSVAQELRVSDPGRAVEFVIASDLVAVCDPRLMRAVLENLLGNAWKFTGRHATARIEFFARDSGGETVYAIRDDGAGFDMAYASKLFKPFTRLHTTEEFPGNGIGLATVRRIVARHGGRVWAEGAIEQGATFFFTLTQRTPDQSGGEDGR